MKLTINDVIIHDDFCLPNNKNYLVIKHELQNPKQENTISLTHFDKVGNETMLDNEGETVSDRAIILRSIKIGEHAVPEVVLYDKTFNAQFTPEQIKEDPTRESSIKYNLYFGYNGTYEYKFSDDSQKHYFENLLEKELPIDTRDKLKIEFINKDDYDDNVIEIKELTIDGINLQHLIYKGEFRPNYNQDWFSKQEKKPPLVYCPCTELRHNGTWHLDISRPIWKMIMEEWKNDDR